MSKGFLNAGFEHEPEVAIVAAKGDLRFVIDEYGERRPRGAGRHRYGGLVFQQWPTEFTTALLGPKVT